MWVAVNIGAVDIALGQIEKIAVPVLAGGHDARDHIGEVYVVGNAQQILALPDLHVSIAAHALDEEHVEPVPRQLAAVLLHEAAVAEDGVHRIDVLEDHFFSGAVEVGIEGKIVFGQALRRYILNHRRSSRGGRWLILADHVVHEVIEHMTGIHGDLVKLRHNAVDAERLVTQLPGFNHFIDRLALTGRDLCAHILKPVGGHVALLAVRGQHLVPRGSSFFQ